MIITSAKWANPQNTAAEVFTSDNGAILASADRPSEWAEFQAWLSAGNSAEVHKGASYAENRATEYPPIGDQLDALFHAGVFPADMAAKIQAVKDKYPKG